MGRSRVWMWLAPTGLAAALSAAAVAAVPPVPPTAAVRPLDPQVAQRGAHIYQTRCAACHEAGVNRAPQRFILNLMAPETIQRALTDGVMRAMATDLDEEGKASVAQFLAQRPLAGAATAPRMCGKEASAFDFSEPPVFSGWGLTPQNSHAVSTARAGLGRANVGRLSLKWALAFPSAVRARSQPALAGGAIFVGSHDGTVFALDRRSGCARWLFHARAEVRTGVVVSPWKAGDHGARPRVYFGDVIGNVYAVDARDGALVWTERADAHPGVTLTAAPVLYGDRLFVPVSSLEEGAAANPAYECCTFRGSLIAYDARSGAKVWQTFVVDPPTEVGRAAGGVRRFGPSGVALWNSPAVDAKRGRLYIATGDNYSAPATPLSDAVLAIDMASGRIVWSYQATADDAWNVACFIPGNGNCPEGAGPDHDFGAAPVLAKASDGRELVVAGQKSGVVWALDPDSGKPVWKTRIGRGGPAGGVHFGVAVVGDRVFAPVNDVPQGGETYTEPPRSGLYALDLRTGKVLWSAPSQDTCAAGVPLCSSGYSGAITATPEIVLSGGNDGWLRAFDAASGKVLWSFSTLRDFATVNGAVGRGGSMGGGGAPLAYHGEVYMNSGYGFARNMPGNVFLSFGVD